MSHFKRYYIPNSLVFITTVTNDRRPVFAVSPDAKLLLDTMHKVQNIHPFHLLAYAVLPDHVHVLMQTQPGANFSQVMQSIKWNYTYAYKRAHTIASPLVLWQRRFWDHIIRDADDLRRHVDYIHYNPVKHGLATAPAQWEHSTFAFWRDRGYYDQDWGGRLPDSIVHMELE